VVQALPYSVRCRVGRLVEARLYLPQTAAEVASFAEELRRVFSRVRDKCVICADWRAATLLAPPVADALVNLLRRGNPFLERSAVLLAADNAVFSLQVERVVREASRMREANHPARRTFRDPASMRAWLAEVLTSEEVRRVDEFLVERE
jgi:hypothetical protein